MEVRRHRGGKDWHACHCSPLLPWNIASWEIPPAWARAMTCMLCHGSSTTRSYVAECEETSYVLLYSSVPLSPHVPSHVSSHVPCIVHVQAAATGSGVVRGKINRDVLAAAFGEDLLASIKAVDSRRAPKPGRDRSFSISSKGSETETDEDGEQKLDVGNDEDGDGEDNSLAALVGSDSNPGKVQVL